MTSRAVSEPSLMAYMDLCNAADKVDQPNHVPTLSERETEVLKAYAKHPEYTDLMIANLVLHYDDPNKVRPRRKALQDEGYIAFVNKRICVVSKKAVSCFRVTTKGQDLLETIYAHEKAQWLLKKKGE